MSISNSHAYDVVFAVPNMGNDVFCFVSLKMFDFYPSHCRMLLRINRGLEQFLQLNIWIQSHDCRVQYQLA